MRLYERDRNVQPVDADWNESVALLPWGCVRGDARLPTLEAF